MKKKNKRILVWIFIIVFIIALVSLILYIRYQSIARKITSFEEFESICISTDGEIFQPSCDTPDYPDCSIETAVCDCSKKFSEEVTEGIKFADIYEDIKDTDYRGCVLD